MLIAALFGAGCTFNPERPAQPDDKDAGVVVFRDAGPVGDAGFDPIDGSVIDAGPMTDSGARDGGTERDAGFPDAGTRDGGLRDGGLIGCGDGMLATGEACDDGNTMSSDGCNAQCEIEDGWCCVSSAASMSSCEREPDLTLRNGQVSEGQPAELTAELSAASQCPVAITWSTMNGSATAPDDYQSVSNQVVTIPPGALDTVLAVVTETDTNTEGTEQFAVLLDDVQGASVVGSGRANVLLLDVAPLADTGLVVRYFLDEVASGTSVAALDSGPNPNFDLPRIGSNNGPTYSTGPSGRGAQWANASGGGAFSSVISQKISSRIDNSARITVEVVVDLVDAASETPVFYIGSNASSAAELVLTDTTVLLRINNAATMTWPVDLRMRGRTVITIVYNSTRRRIGDRIDLYLDGVPGPISDFGPAQNLAINTFPNDFFLIGNRPMLSSSLEGTIDYVAIYDQPLTRSEIVANAAILAVSHDAP